jgi:hypothetical protein
MAPWRGPTPAEPLAPVTIGTVERLGTRVVYTNPWMTVREDRVLRDDGSSGIYGVVEKPDFALVVPREQDGFWMVEQHRYPVDRRAWEFPQGSWAQGSSGTAMALAHLEEAVDDHLAGRRHRRRGLRAVTGFADTSFWFGLHTTSDSRTGAHARIRRHPAMRDMARVTRATRACLVAARDRASV